MSLKTTHEPGDAILAADMNSVHELAILNSHNILELYLENFFAAKTTPFNGLFFDGFSDTSKADVSATLVDTVSADSGQEFIQITDGDTTKFDTDRPNITIFDDTNAEEKIISEVIPSFPDETNQQFVPFPSVGVNTDGNEIDSTADLTAQTFTPSKTGRVTSVVMELRKRDTLSQGTHTTKVEIQTVSGGQPTGTVLGTSDDDTRLIDGSFQITYTFTTKPEVTKDVQFAIVLVPVTVQSGKVFEVIGSTTDGNTGGKGLFSTNTGSTWTDGGSQISVADYIFKLNLEQVSKLKLTTNLANTYAVGSDVKRSTVNFDTTNKEIEFPDTTEPIGDNKLAVYYSKLQGFQQAMASIRLWVVRGNRGENANSKVIDLERSSSQHLSITDAAQTGLDITSDITLEAWLNPESQLTMQIMSKRNDFTSQKSYDFIYVGSTTTLILGISNDGSSREALTKVQSIPNGVWTHVAVVWDASTSTAEFFINGVSIGTDTGAKTSIFSGSADFFVGAFTDGSPTVTDFFDGKIDDIRVWDDKRTGAEILANFEKQLTGSEANLQAYWKFNGDLLDTTLNNNDLTNNGGAVFSPDVPYFEDNLLNPSSTIAFGATTLTITGDKTNIFADGNTIDVSTSDNVTRERKTLTATPSFAAGVTTLTFTPSIQAASGFDTTAIIERVSILPEISVVNKGDPESFSSITFVRSLVDFDNDEAEDEYLFEPSTPNEDVTIKLELTREDISPLPIAKRLGVVLIE